MQEIKHLIKQWDIKVKNNKRLFFSNDHLYILHNLLSEDFVEIVFVLKKYMITLYQVKRNIATLYVSMGKKNVNFPHLQCEQ